MNEAVITLMVAVLRSEGGTMKAAKEVVVAARFGHKNTGHCSLNMTAAPYNVPKL